MSKFVGYITNNGKIFKPNMSGDGKMGATGEKGEPFKYEDFTEEQLEELKGEKGESYDDTEVRNLISNTLDEAKRYTDVEIATFDFIKIVTVLPNEGLPNRFYLVPKTNASSNDFFDEYVWANDMWEFIGTVQVEVDLTDYALKSEIPEIALDINAMPIATGAQSMISPIINTGSGEVIYEINYNDAEFIVTGDNHNKLTLKSVPWEKIENKPSTYTPSAHTHLKSEITNLNAVESSDVKSIEVVSEYPSPEINGVLYIKTGA